MQKESTLYHKNFKRSSEQEPKCGVLNCSLGALIYSYELKTEGLRCDLYLSDLIL